MENNYRLKIKVGQHEFDAEGPADVVQAQFQVWKDMIAFLPGPPAPQPQTEARLGENLPLGRAPKPDLASIDASLAKIMEVRGRVIALTVRPKSVEDAIMMLLYGHRIMREDESITGGEILQGLAFTGGLNFNRIDRVMEKLATDGNVIVTGEHRAKRYRSTFVGLQKARQLASDLLATVA